MEKDQWPFGHCHSLGCLGCVSLAATALTEKGGGDAIHKVYCMSGEIEYLHIADILPPV